VDSKLTPENTLPADGFSGTLVGRAWVPGKVAGPSVVVLTEKGVYSISNTYPTMSDLLNAPNPTTAAKAAVDTGRRLGSFEDLLAYTGAGRMDPENP